MKKLIKLELDRFSLKPHLIGLVIANIIILFLCVLMSVILKPLGEFMISAGLPDVNLSTISLCNMLVRATLIVWQGIFIAKLIIEEYQNKTISLLYTYPVNRAKLIFAKLLLIGSIIFLFHAISSFFQHTAVFFISTQMSFVTYSLENVIIQLLIIFSTILLAFVPLSIGMINKSSIATVVSSIIIVAFASNSQGSTAGLLSIPIIALVLGAIGLVVVSVTVKKMINSDLQV